jgi:hypothetical protein
MDKDTIFQYYPARVRSNTPIGTISLGKFIDSTRSPKPRTLAIFKAIEQADIDGDKQRKAELKQNNLYYFTPCVYVDGGRCYAKIKHFTGLLVGDFDHIVDAIGLKVALFNEYSSIIAAWLSPSRRGVKVLFKIPVVSSVPEFKEYYFGLAAELDYITGFDPSGQNSVLPLFQSYDPDILVRDNPDTWTTKGMKSSDFDRVKPSPPAKIVHSDSAKGSIEKMIQTGFGNISNVGHPNLRSLCLAIGGYVANGYISESEALSLIDDEISKHHYLRKGISGYQKTARWAVENGKCNPLILGK